MASVQQPALEHPGPMSQRQSDTPDELDQELDWLIEKEEEKDTATNSPAASSPLQSPEGESNENKMRKADTHYPRSPSPRYSPRDQKQTLPQDEPQSDEEDSPVSMGNNGKSGKTADDEDDENYDDDYEMSEDQKQAMMELQNMKLDLAYTVDEEPPEYDVTERVRQLNEELAKEPSPDDERERAIKFQSDPVSLVVPPPDYTESEEEENQTQNKENSEAKGNTMSGVSTGGPVKAIEDKEGEDNFADDDEDEKNLYDDDFSSPRSQDTPTSVDKKHDEETDTVEEKEQDEEDNFDKKGDSKGGGGDFGDGDDVDDGESIASDAAKQEQTKTQKPGNGGDKKDSSSESGDEEKVLVERNGTFELLAAKDLTAEERIMYGVQTEEDKASSRKETSSKAESVNSKSSSESSDYLPTPPVHPRPATASVTSERRKRMAANRRAQSASQKPTYHTKDYDDFNYMSPYALDPEKRKEYRKEYNEKKKQERDEEERKQKQKEKDQQDAEDAFQAWLSKKREESAKRRNEENKRKKTEKEQREREENDENGDCSESANQKNAEGVTFDDWREMKRSEKQKQQRITEAQRQEMEDGYSTSHRNECNKAFREWLRKKNTDLRRQQIAEKQKYRVTRLLARRSRKSQQLAKAITHAQAFKYVDYYGYRY